MNSIYSKPLRIYIILGALGIWGLLSGVNLPTSLFPKSGQSTIGVSVPNGNLTSQQFFDIYGKNLESALQSIKINGSSVKDISTEFRGSGFFYKVSFDWGVDPEKALIEVQNVVNTNLSNAKDEIKRNIAIYPWSENRGFFAVSFFSPLRSLDEVYEILSPTITPIKSQIEDAGDFGLWNPNFKEISIYLMIVFLDRLLLGS